MYIRKENDIILFLAWRFQKVFINKYKELFLNNKCKLH